MASTISEALRRARPEDVEFSERQVRSHPGLQATKLA